MVWSNPQNISLSGKEADTEAYLYRTALQPYPLCENKAATGDQLSGETVEVPGVSVCV